MRLFRRLFGSDDEDEERQPGMERRKRPRTSVSSVLATNPARFDPTRPEPEQQQPEPEPEAESESEDSGLTLDETPDDGGDPYDTGSYKPPDVWSKVRKADEDS